RRHNVHAGSARRCGHGPRRSGTGNGVAPRLGNTLCQRPSLPGKSASDVLGSRHRFPAVWRLRVDGPPAVGCWHACATSFLGKRIFGETGGFGSALVLATAVGPYIYTRFLIPEILVGLWLTLGLGFFLRTLDEEVPSRLACWGLAVTMALNVLTKGLIGVVFPVGAIFLYLLLTGNLRHILHLRLVSSFLVFLAVAAPWHVLAALRNPDQGPVRGFLWFYFVNEHFLRYLNKRMPRDYDTVPLVLFWILTAVWLIPWTSFLPQALASIPHRWGEIRSRL